MSKHLETLRRELAAVAAAAAYFLVWLGALMLLKVLILEEYQIPYHQFSLVLVGALSLSKVVLLLERVPLGGVTGPRPAWIEVAARTGLYVGGVFVYITKITRITRAITICIILVGVWHTWAIVKRVIDAVTVPVSGKSRVDGI